MGTAVLTGSSQMISHIAGIYRGRRVNDGVDMSESRNEEGGFGGKGKMSCNVGKKSRLEAGKTCSEAGEE
jgi:hypothetical protein